MSDFPYSARDVTSSFPVHALRERLNHSLESGPRRWKTIGIAMAFLVAVGGWAYNAVGGEPVGAAASLAALPRATSSTVPGGANPQSSGVPSVSEAHIVVQVAGAVVKPGVYEMSTSARANDAVAKAGGILPDADVDRVNLALKLTDGQHVFVPRNGEAAPSVGTATTNAGPSGPINLNSATLQDLDALPGVGPSTAQAIIDYREEHGPFKSVQTLNEVKGIGDSKFADLKNKVTV